MRQEENALAVIMRKSENPLTMLTRGKKGIDNEDQHQEIMDDEQSER